MPLKKKNITLSIIIVNYNGGKLLTDTLSTLYENTRDISFEVIIVDNASTEGNVIEELKPFPEVKLIINDKNLGFAAANNQGVKISNGEYILLLNNDMIFIENTIKVALDYISNSSEKLLIGPKTLNTDKSLQISIGKFDTLWYIFSVNFFLYILFPKSVRFNKYYYNFQNFRQPTEVDLVKGSFILMKRSDFNDLDGFDENFFFYGEETDLCYRFRKAGGKVIFHPGTEIIHLGGGVSNKMPWFKYRYQSLAKIRTYRKVFPRWKFILALLFHYCGLLLRIPVYLAASLLKFDKEILYKSFYYFKQLFVYPKR